MNSNIPKLPRRLLLAGAVATATYSHLNLPLVWAQPAATSTTPATGPFPAFLAISQKLTGHETLGVAQATHLYDALVVADSGFAAQLAPLADFMAQRNPDLVTLQSALDADKAPFAKLPATILVAWYVGVAGAGKVARCITYETSLMHVAVADRLKPPSYAYGPYGSWSRNPLSNS